MRVAIYARVPKVGQSIENQVSALREVRQRLGWDAVGVFGDHANSGSKGAGPRRRAFDRLLHGVVRLGSCRSR